MKACLCHHALVRPVRSWSRCFGTFHLFPTLPCATVLTIKHCQGLDEAAIFKRDVNWMKVADMTIADVSVPSLGVGYELSYLVGRGKPVLALYNSERAAIEDTKLSAMIRGDSHIKVIVSA